MLVDTYNQQGKKLAQARLPKEVFDVKVNSDLVHQVMISQLANQRRVIAHTKDRGEVRGGGKKPWAQKGTGHARVGSIRSPIWKGGGVTFGPSKERVFKKKIPKKMRRKALFMVLSGKAKDNFLVLLDKLEIEMARTKIISEILQKLPCKTNPTLIALPAYDKKIILAAKNLPKVRTIQAKELNVLDLLSFKYLLLTKEAIKIIKDTFSRQES